MQIKEIPMQAKVYDLGNGFRAEVFLERDKTGAFYRVWIGHNACSVRKLFFGIRKETEHTCRCWDDIPELMRDFLEGTNYLTTFLENYLPKRQTEA